MGSSIRSASLALLAACATHWHSHRADKPVTPAELDSRPLAIARQNLQGPALLLRDQLVRAMAERGFHLVSREAMRWDMELFVDLKDARAVATLRSGSGFFIDEASASLPADPAWMANWLAESSGVESYVRYGWPAITRDTIMN